MKKIFLKSTKNQKILLIIIMLNNKKENAK